MNMIFCAKVYRALPHKLNELNVSLNSVCNTSAVSFLTDTLSRFFFSPGSLFYFSSFNMLWVGNEM